MADEARPSAADREADRTASPPAADLPAALQILSRRCLSCHNSTERQGDLSLETQQDLADSGFVIPGNPQDSHLLSVVTAGRDGTAPAMPKDSDALSAADQQALADWIAAGAAWPAGLRLQEPVLSDFDWWSFRPLVRPEVPLRAPEARPGTEAEAAAWTDPWIRNPIDAFLLFRQRQQQLQPSPEADRRTLIRRVTYDLIGLPPTPEEVAAFVADPAADAWERLVDRLLASPQYGERWAQHWLDVVKYADTCGYDKDKLRPHAWPYRDYVVRSLNNDKPYARFVQEQLAGDVLFPGEADGILGLGFIAAGPWDFIGHVEVPESRIDGKVARNLDRDDMVSNALNTFCSITIQCARCHNHKFDPFTQQHYYGLQAVFAAVDRADRVYDQDPAVEQRRQQLTQSRDQLRSQLQELQSAVQREGGERLQLLEQQIATLQPRAVPGQVPVEYGYHSGIVPAAETEKWVQVDLGQEVDIAQIVLHPCYDDFNRIGAGFGFPVRYRVTVSREDPTVAAGDSSSQTVRDASQSDVINPGLAPVVIDCRASSSVAADRTAQAVVRARYVRVTALRLALRQQDYHLALSELRVLDAAGRNLAAGAAVTALDSIEAPARWAARNLTDELYPQSADPAAAAELLAARTERSEILQRLETPERVQERERLTAAVQQAEMELAGLPAGQLVYAAATSFPAQGNFRPTQGQPRPVHVLHRGNETQPGAVAVPGTVPLAPHDVWQFDLGEQHTEGERRAALARWITRGEHPLTWRSIVNRVWQYHFGRGLVDSPNDFGRMGQQPAHPELLDWLAVDFRDHGQSFKRLHRLIVTSAAYRQSSADNPRQSALDGDNQFVWRMHRRRLEAEEIRDSILAVSGKLQLQMGGPGFYAFELEKPEHSPHYEYAKFDPRDARSHRRSIYRFVVRSQPDPFMTTLDCADSSQSTPRRSETLTSLQALSLLNNRFSLALAESFAERLQGEAPTLAAQVARGFELCTGRQPDAAEQARMLQYAEQHGLASLCRLLFNLSEFLFVD